MQQIMAVLKKRKWQMLTLILVALGGYYGYQTYRK